MLTKVSGASGTVVGTGVGLSKSAVCNLDIAGSLQRQPRRRLSVSLAKVLQCSLPTDKALLSRAGLHVADGLLLRLQVVKTWIGTSVTLKVGAR